MIKFITIILLIFTGIIFATEGVVINKMPHPVYGGQAVVLGKYIYIMGGSDSLNRPVDAIQIYDPIANEWKLNGRMRHARYGFVADALNDSNIVYCGGMWRNSNDMFSIEIWNPYIDGIGNAVVGDYNVNFNRFYFTGHVYKEELFLFGGLSTPSSADSIYQPYIISYNLSDRNTIRLQEHLYEGTFPPYHHMSVRIDSIVYLIGGVHFNVTNKVIAFNLITHELTREGSLAGVRAGGKAINYRDTIYIIGGFDESNKALKTVERYSRNENVTIDKFRLQYARNEPMAAIYEDAIYVFGGKNELGFAVSEVEKLDIVSSSISEKHPVPDQILLYDNYPNPFNATTHIRFDIDRPSEVTLDIYSVEGKLVKSLFKGSVPPGNHNFMWQGDDNQHKPVASGIYIYRLISGNKIFTRKMVMVK